MEKNNTAFYLPSINQNAHHQKEKKPQTPKTQTQTLES